MSPRRPARPRTRPHTYMPDLAAPADHRGDRPCATCGLPRRNAAHTDPEPAGPDAQSLAAGDTRTEP